MFPVPGLNRPARFLREGATKDANFTASKWMLYPVDMSGESADIVVTFPTNPAAGDTFGWYIKTNHASHSYSAEALSTTSIRGSTSHDNKWSCWIKGELLVFRYDGSTWQVLVDGRIPHMGLMRKTASSTTASGSGGAWAQVTADHTADVNNAGIVDTANNRMVVKRTGSYAIDTAVQIQAVPDTIRIRSRATVAGTTSYPGPSFINGSGGNEAMSTISANLAPVTAGEAIIYEDVTTNGSALDVFGGSNQNTFLRVEERLS